MEFFREPVHVAEPRGEGIVRLRGKSRELRADLGNPLPVCGDFLAGEKRLLFAGLERGQPDFFRLVGEEIEFAGQRGSVLGEALFFPGQPHPFLPRGGVGEPERVCTSKAVHKEKLLVFGKQALVVMRPVEVHEQVADLPQEREGAGGSVRELFPGPVRGERAANDEAALLARFDTSFVEERVERRRLCEKKNPLDRAGLAAGADHGFVGTLADEKLDPADEDRLPRARLSGDHNKAAAGFP